MAIRKTDLFGKTFRGTGFFVGPSLIATNHHVVKEARMLGIEAAGGVFYTFRQMRAEDPVADTALLEIVEKSPHFLRLDPIGRVEVGEPIYVIGNPQGYTRTLSQGLVSGIRTLGENVLYQVSANVSQGSSGSPVIDAWGQAIGIVFGRLPDEAQIAFATPAANLVALRDGGWQPAARIAASTVPSSRSLFPEIQLGSLPSAPKGGKDIRRRAAKDVVRIGVPNWDSGIVIAHLLKEAIERFFPVTIELVPALNDDILAGIEANDRSFDVHPDVWLPNHRALLTQRANLSSAHYAATQGICVPRYVLARFSVRARTDLTSPTVARLFDSNGDGRSEIWIGEEDWASTRIERLKARDYRYAPHFELVTGKERNIYQSLDRLAAVQRPIAFYCYGPHWVLRKQDLVILRERPYAPTCFHLADKEKGAAWYDRSHASCAGPLATVHRAYSDRVAEELPAVTAFLDQLSFDYEELSELIFDMVGGQRENTTVAKAWVDRKEAQLRKFVAAQMRQQFKVQARPAGPSGR